MQEFKLKYMLIFAAARYHKYLELSCQCNKDSKICRFDDLKVRALLKDCGKCHHDIINGQCH